MSSKRLISCYGCSLDLCAILHSARTEVHLFGPAHVIRTLPGQHVELIENPYRSQVEASILRFCDSIGLDKAEQYYSQVDGGRLAALCYPECGPRELRICDMLLMLVFMFDDALDVKKAGLGQSSDLAMALKSAMAAQPVPFLREHPLVRLAIEIRHALDELYPSRAWMKRFRQAFDGFIDMALRTAKRWMSGDPSVDLVRYLHERYHDVAVGIFLALVELTQHQELAEHIVEHPDILVWQSTCTFNIALANDIFSYHKEVIKRGNLNNSIAVFQLQFGLPFDQAVCCVALIIRDFFEQFEILSNRLYVSSDIPIEVRTYIQGMRTWMVGSLRWSLETPRYRHAESPFPQLRWLLRMDSQELAAPEMSVE